MKYINLKLIMITITISFVLIVILLSPLFNVSNVNIVGNEELTEGYITESIGLMENNSVLAFNSRNAENELMKNTYVENVNVNKNILKRSIDIEIEERNLSGYVEYVDGNYLYIDENGIVLEVSKSFTKKLPVIVGLDIDSFSLGQPLEASNSEAIENMVVLSHLFNKYGMSDDVVRVDLSDPKNAHLYVDNVDVYMGDIKDADKKIRTVEAALSQLDEGIVGFLYVEDITKPPIFRIMT